MVAAVDRALTAATLRSGRPSAFIARPSTAFGTSFGKNFTPHNVLEADASQRTLTGRKRRQVSRHAPSRPETGQRGRRGDLQLPGRGTGPAVLSAASSAEGRIRPGSVAARRLADRLHHRSTARRPIERLTDQQARRPWWRLGGEPPRCRHPLQEVTACAGSRP